MIIDTYIKSESEKTLLDFLFTTETINEQETVVKVFPNIIKPRKGLDALPVFVTEDGLEIPAQPQRGDPEYWYACLRTEEAVELPEGIVLCSKEEGQQVCGVWA